MDIASESGEISGLLIMALILLAMPCMASSAVDSVSDRPVVHLFEASPSMVNPGANATLNWAVSRADVLFVNPGEIRLNLGNSSSGISEINGSLAVRPINSTNYTLIAGNSFGNITANTSVIVNKSLETPKEINQPLINYFQATPSTIMTGESATLSWSVYDATEVTISGLGRVALKGSMAITPVGTTTYVLAAKNAGGVVRAHTAVVVEKPIQSKPVINYFGASKGVISRGDSTTLSWSVSGASGVDINGRRVGSSGAISVSPSYSTAYTLSACNDGGCVSNSAYIEVGEVAIQPINLMPQPQPEIQPEPDNPIQLM